MPDLLFNRVVGSESDGSIISRAGFAAMPSEYFDWLLNCRDEIIRIISANPSISTQAFAVAPLNNLPPDVLASAIALINTGRIAEAVTKLIEALISEVERELIKDLSKSIAADFSEV